MAYQDHLLMFDEAAALTVTRNSTNVIDLLRAGQDIGNGENLWVEVSVPTAFTAGGSATLQVELVTSADAALGTPTVLHDQSAVIAVATLVAGFVLQFRFPVHNTMLRYLGLIYTVATGPMTAGNITAGIQKDIQRTKAYPRNYTVA